MTGKAKLTGATATVNRGYKLDGWYDEAGAKVGTSEVFAGYEFTAENGKEYTFTAKISEILDDHDSDGIPDKYQAKVKYVVSDTEHGELTVSEEIVTIYGTGGEYAMTGTAKLAGSTVTAVPGFRFDGWYDGADVQISLANTLADYEFTADSDEEYTFTAKISENLDDNNSDGIADKYQATVKYVVSDAEAGSLTVSEEIVDIFDEDGKLAMTGKAKLTGSEVTVVTGYRFGEWKDADGNSVCSDKVFADYEFEAVSGMEYVFTAQFTKKPANVTINTIPGKQEIKLPAEVKAMIEEARKSLTDAADISANKMYATVPQTVTISENTAYVNGSDNKVENYIVYGADETKTKYTPTLPENTELVSDVIYVDTLKPVDNILIDFKVSDGENKGIYKFSEALGKWIYVGGTYDDYRKVIKLTVNTSGKYAVLARSETDIFEDVSGIWSELYINSLAYASLVNGYAVEDKLFFRPENDITRGEFVKMLVSAKGVALDATDVSMFDDEAEIAEWVKPYAAAAAKNGWLKGSAVGDKLYANLEEKITRQDAMTIIYRAFYGENTDKVKVSFSDAGSISDYAYDAVAILTTNGVVSGFTDNTVRPLENVKREQVAKMLWYCIVIAG